MNGPSSGFELTIESGGRGVVDTEFRNPKEFSLKKGRSFVISMQNLGCGLGETRS
jgi:hypothetical protein